MAPVNMDANADLLNWFKLVDGELRWTDRETAAPHFPPRQLAKLKKTIIGKRAGSRRVCGRGWIVHCSGRRFLSVDLRDAIVAGFFWPWDIGQPLGVDPHGDEAEHADEARRMWRIEPNGDLVWAQHRYITLPEGSPAGGAELTGPRGCFISHNKHAYLVSDVRHLLEHGAWPWETKIDWD